MPAFAAAAIPAWIGAGASVASGVMGAHAAGSAADQEQQSALQARAYQQQATQQALGRLDTAQQGMRYAPTYTAPGAQSSGAYGALAGAMGLGSRPATPQMQTPYAPPLVQMRSPTGEVQGVPANQVDHYKAKGAQLV